MLGKLKKIDIIELLILFMPLIDVFNTITGISLSLLYRGLFLAIILFIFLFKNDSKYKNSSFCLLFLIFCFSMVFCVNFYLTNGFSNIFKEISSLIKFIYLPVTTICLVNYYDNKDLKINEIMLKLAWIYIIYLIIPTIFGISYSSYDYGKKGFTGLFYAPNEVGTILAILTPFVIFNLQKKESKIFSILLGILFIITTFILGTKTPVIGLAITLLGVLIISIIRQIISKNNIKNIIINICLIFFSLFIYNHSYLIFNMHYQGNIYDVNNFESTLNNPTNVNFYNSDELYKNDYLINFPISYNKNDLKEIDNKLLNIIFSSRNIYMAKNLNAYKNSSLTKKIIGLSLYGEVKNNVGKLVELDFVDILVNYGIVGTLVLSLYLIIIAISVLIRFLKKFKENIMDDQLCATYLGFLIALLIALTAGHTLGAPAVSTFLALTMVYLIKKYNLLKNYRTGGIVLVAISSLYVIFTISYLVLPMESKIINIKIDNDIYFENDINLVENETIKYNGIKDELYYYSVNDYSHFKIVVVKRTIDKDNKIMFLTFSNDLDKNVLVNIEFNENYDNYQKGVNNLVLSGDKNIIISDSYHYNNINDDVKQFNKNIVKNLLIEQQDYSEINNKVKKSFNIKSNTSVDTYVIISKDKLIKQDELIPWLSYNGIYNNISNYYIRDFENIDLKYEESFNNILIANYLMTLYNYTNNYNNFFYKDFEIINNSNVSHNDINIDLNYNHNIFKNLDLYNDFNVYEKFSNIIKDEYNKKNYLTTDRGIIFNSVETTFDNQIGILNILLEYYNKNKITNIKNIINQLLNELTNNKWLIGDKDIHSYVTNELNYGGTIKNYQIVNNLIDLKENLHKVGINKKEIDNYINILFNKFKDTFDSQTLNNLKNNGYF